MMNHIPESLTQLERNVIHMLISGEGGAARYLQQQVDVLRVREREFTGVGFFTELIVTEAGKVVPSLGDFRLGDVVASHPRAPAGIGFVLFVSKGAIARLEGYAFDGPWPDEEDLIHLSYVNNRKRDMQWLLSRADKESA